VAISTTAASALWKAHNRDPTDDDLWLARIPLATYRMGESPPPEVKSGARPRK
jgi:hypothetical protein